MRSALDLCVVRTDTIYHEPTNRATVCFSMSITIAKDNAHIEITVSADVSAYLLFVDEIKLFPLYVVWSYPICFNVFISFHCFQLCVIDFSLISKHWHMHGVVEDSRMSIRETPIKNTDVPSVFYSPSLPLAPLSVVPRANILFVLCTSFTLFSV